MADAWETLVAGSTLTSGDAWEHLQAQGGTGTYVILADGLEVEMATTEVEVSIDQTAVDVVLDATEIDLEIEQSPLEVEI